MLRGFLRTDSEREFWAYVVAITDNLFLDRLGAAGREAASGEGERDSLGACFDSCTNGDEAAVALHRLLLSLRGDEDRELVLWRLRGTPYETVARSMGARPATLRQRWSKLCLLLRAGDGEAVDR